MENEVPINSERVREPDPSSEADLFHRRIEFHVARKPFNGFSSSSNGFKLVTLNPNSGTHQESAPAKKSERSECSDSGFDPELRLEITFRRIGAGLRNLGNTCFLNSVLQCLTYTEPLAAYLQSGKHQNSCRNAGFCALCAIQKHVSRALHANGRILEPKDLVSNLRCISRNFRNSRQEDAHEYMVNLLESMHKCCLPSGVPSESPTAYEKSLVHKIFGGRLRSQVKCMQCSFCSNKFDPFMDLSLEIAKADSLQKAFCHFTAKEQLDGGAKQYQCQQCKQKVKALKQLTIHKAPHVLTVHLKRFGHVHGQKIDKKIAFGPTLDLKPFVSGSYEGDLTYTLYGVLVHAGWSTHSGHYYCFVRTSSGMWYSLDDNQVFQVNERKVLEQKAYILFYVRDRKNYFTKKQVDVFKEENKTVNAIRKSTQPEPVLDSSVKVHNGSIGNNVDASLSAALSVSDRRVSLAQKDNSFEKISLHNANGHIANGKDPLSEPLLANPTENRGEDHHMKTNNVRHEAESSSTIEGNGDTLNASTFVDCSPNSSVLKDSHHKKDTHGSVTTPSIGSQDRTKRTLSESIDRLPNVKALDMTCEGANKTENANEKTGDVSENVNHVKASSQNGIENERIGVNLKTLEDRHGLMGVQSRSPELLVPTENLSCEIVRNKQPQLKVKRKLFSRHAPTMILSSSIILCAAFYSRKKKRKAKKHRMQKTLHNQKPLSEENDITSSTGKSICAESVSLPMDNSTHLRKKVKHAKSISCNGSISSDVVTNDLKGRVTHGGATLAAQNQPQTKQSAAQGPHSSGLRRGQSSQNDVMSMLTRGLEETTVARWDGINVAISEKTGTTAAETSQIGFIGDEWDEEYDKGKRKKIRSNKITFGGPNLFQEMASRNSGRKRAKVEQGSLENPPFRI